MLDEKQEYKVLSPTTGYWTDLAQFHLLGRKIVAVGYMTPEMTDEFCTTQRGVWFRLDNGEEVFVMSDDEGNDSGSLHIHSNGFRRFTHVIQNGLT